MIKTIIFDYAGVLTPTKDNYKFAKKFADSFKLDPLSLLEITYMDWDKALVGEISSEKFWEKVSARLHTDPELLKTSIIKTFPIDKRMVRLIQKIKGKKIVLLSNQIQDWLEKVIQENDLKDKFDYIIASYQVKLKKPDKRIYRIALERSSSEPEESLFIDDNYENIAAAKELGLQVILFKNFKQFKREFDQYMNE